jgi:fermentation-respiration switch protein FrsA (DUF1100 family)
MLLAAAIIALTYIGLCLYAWLMADELMFPDVTPSYSMGSEADGWVVLHSADGERITARYWHASESTLTLLYNHGNGEDIGRIAWLMQAYQSRGISVLAYDYPGYGTSSGRPTERGIFLAAEAAYDYLRESKGVPAAHIIPLGRSIGSGPAVHIAANREVGGLIIESAFTSAFRVMTKRRLLPWDRFNNLAAIRRVQAPVLMIHGTDDRIIPFWHAERLQAALRVPNAHFWVAGAGHNNLIEMAGENYWRVIQAFLDGLEDA